MPKEVINDLFNFEDEDNVLIIPVTIAFRHGGGLIMDKGIAKQALEYYPTLSGLYGAWHKQYSREPLYDTKTNTISFPIKLSTKEMVSETFMELSLQKLLTVISNQLVGKRYYIPAFDAQYQDVDVYGIIKKALDTYPYTAEIIIVRDVL